MHRKAYDATRAKATFPAEGGLGAIEILRDSAGTAY
jgi:hypothetical protein